MRNARWSIVVVVAALALMAVAFALPTRQAEAATAGALAPSLSPSQEITGTETVTGTEAMTDEESVHSSREMTGTEEADTVEWPLSATADLIDADGNSVGAASFTQSDEGEPLEITVEVEGMQEITPGAHGIHIHQVGRCEPDFAVAGDHFNPMVHQHGLENPQGPHAGDLPDIEFDADGNAGYAATSELLTLSDGPASILATDGSAIIIHAKPDDQRSNPSGRSGARLICGVIAAAEASEPPPPLEVAIVQPEQRSPTPERIAQLSVPEGFTVTVFARDLGNARLLAQGEDGTIYVTRPGQGDVLGISDSDGDGVAEDAVITATSELSLVHGIIISGSAVYLATPTHIYQGEIGDDGSFGELTALVDDLPAGGQHPRRTMAFGPDGLLYVGVGSPCNACTQDNPEWSTILQVQPDGSTRMIYASGLRNTLGFGWHPETGELWGMDQNIDWMGNDQPGEELNRIEEGANYGYPYCIEDKQVNEYIATRPAGQTKAEFCAESVAPVLSYQAHSSPIGMVFHTGEQFPEEYSNSAFVAMRGSWNRMPATGYKVIHIEFDEEGQPVEFHDFLTGFLIEDGMAHFGRVAGLLVAADGSLLVADDTNGMIYRVAYEGGDE